MKKIFTALLFIIYTLTITAYASDDITVYLNGEKLSFEQEPIIRDDSTLVPMRAIFEKLGMEVVWNGEEKSITSKTDGTVIKLYIGGSEMDVNGKNVTLNTPAVIYNDYTLVPLRAVSESAGADVRWENDTRTVYITVNSDDDLENFAQEIVRLTNEERKKNGMYEVKWDNSLANLAAAHCADMIGRGYFHHDNPDGETPFDRLKKANIEYWLAGENIAAGQPSPERAFKAWMNSETHRENILNPAFMSIGVAVLRGGDYGIYWVQEFALLK